MLLKSLTKITLKAPKLVFSQKVDPFFYRHIKSKREMSTDLESGKRLAQFSFSVLFDLLSKKSKVHDS